MKISEISIKRPVFATMMIIALLVLGATSYLDLPVELWPEIEFPFVLVQTVYPGASAETIETEVTDKIEESVNQISGIRHITSQSQEGYTITFIEFELEVDGDLASQDVREKVAAIRADLPEDIDEPVVSQFDPGAQAVMSIAIGGRRPAREVTQLVKDRVKPRLESVTGVGAVQLAGGEEREILISLNPELMEGKQVSVEDVRNAVAAANLEIPGGRVDESDREYTVRIKGKIERPSDFGSVVVANRQGRQILLSDVAAVKDTIEEQRSMATFEQKPAVALEVIKQSGANVVALAEEIKHELKQLQDELPKDISIEIVNDNSTFITDSIHEIQFNIVFGTILAVIVIFLFLLDLRPTIITGLSIPISIVATFTLMKMLGFTLNFMTLLGLSLAVGILIDDSIVVVENIYRKIQEGESPFKAAFSGTKEIGLAVAATTFAIMVVFLPVAFMAGIVGRFFYQFGMTVAFAVLISLFVAFSLVPMLTSITKAPKEDKDSLNPKNARGLWRLWLRLRSVLNIWNRAFDSIKPVYKRLLSFSLRWRWLVYIVATSAFVLSIAMVMVGMVGFEFMTQADQGKFYIWCETPQGTTLEQTAERMQTLEQMLLDNFDEVSATYLTVGGENTPVTEATMLVLLTDASTRELSAKELVDSARGYAYSIPGLSPALALEVGEGGSEKPLEFSVRGEDRDEIARIAEKVEAIVRDIPGTIDVDNNMEEGKPEFQVTIDRKLAEDLGLDVYAISSTVRALVEGEVVTRYKDEFRDEDYDVRIRLDESYRNSEEAVGRLLIASHKDVVGRETLLVPLSRVAQITRGETVGQYNRYDRMPDIRVNANILTGFAAGSVTSQAQAVIDSVIQLPPGYTAAPIGEQEIMVESFTHMARALLLAIIFIFLVLASLYDSFFDPISIMVSLPLSLVGAIVGLWAFNSNLSIMSMVGIVMLMGLVTKNAILLIDFVKQRREDGVDRTNAILEAGPIRLRPILMTTLATVFGMLPLALGLGPGAELRAPMARAVIGGMLSSTLLTLVVVPVVYASIDDWTNWLGRKGRKLMGRKQVDEPTVTREPQTTK